MINKLKALEKVARQLEPERTVRKKWDKKALKYAGEFLKHLPETPAYAANDKGKLQDEHFKINGNTTSFSRVLQQIKEQVDGIGINPASGGHFGYVPGGGVYPSALGDYLAAVSNRYAGLFFATPGAVKMENELIRWMCQVMGFPDTALGNLTSGGSIANLIAVTTARESRQLKARDFDKQVFYLTRQTHHCAQKAFRIAGMQEAVYRYIAVDDHFRMDTRALQRQIQIDLQTGLKPFLLVASAGTTDTGALDPLDAIAKICAQHQIWMHVDAAYGGFFILVDALKGRFKGIEKADSITTDPHKGLFLPYGSGAVLIKDASSLYESHFYKANYLQDTDLVQGEISPADLSPELTKHFRGMRMWIPLQLFGLQPFQAALEEKVLLCQYFYQEVQKIGFEVGPFPDLSIMIFRFPHPKEKANEYNALIVEKILEDGRVFVSTTTLEGIYWIRLAVVCFRTHRAHVDLMLSILKEIVAEPQPSR